MEPFSTLNRTPHSNYSTQLVPEPCAPVSLLSSIKNARGFTLVEMLVVLGIITVVTTITLLGHSNFDRTMLLTDAAYTVALSAREMQTYGLSSRVTATFTNIGYGLYINASAPTSYVTYADINRITSVPHCPSGSNPASPEYKRGNCLFETTSPADTIVQTYSFSRGFRISRFCGRFGSNTYCSNDASNPLTSLDVVFMRPNTDAIVSGRRSTGAPIELTSAQIYLSTANGLVTRGICITQIGQISVSEGNCP